MINASGSSKGFLIDGYPREVEQGIKFENTASKKTLVLYSSLASYICYHQRTKFKM